MHVSFPIALCNLSSLNSIDLIESTLKYVNINNVYKNKQKLMAAHQVLLNPKYEALDKNRYEVYFFTFCVCMYVREILLALGRMKNVHFSRILLPMYD